MYKHVSSTYYFVKWHCKNIKYIMAISNGYGYNTNLKQTLVNKSSGAIPADYKYRADSYICTKCFVKGRNRIQINMPVMSVRWLVSSRYWYFCYGGIIIIYFHILIRIRVATRLAHNLYTNLPVLSPLGRNQILVCVIPFASYPFPPPIYSNILSKLNCKYN
jgi:hypothetical protein